MQRIKRLRGRHQNRNRQPCLIHSSFTYISFISFERYKFRSWSQLSSICGDLTESNITLIYYCFIKLLNIIELLNCNLLLNCFIVIYYWITNLQFVNCCWLNFINSVCWSAKLWLNCCWLNFDNVLFSGIQGNFVLQSANTSVIEGKQWFIAERCCWLNKCSETSALRNSGKSLRTLAVYYSFDINLVLVQLEN